MQRNGATKLNLKELKDKFLFIVVGGCDAIGTNFYLYHYAGHWIAVDYGLGFADKLKTPGVEILLPNISFLKNNNIKLDALIITHSHEDHIGGVCEMYKHLKCPIYCTKFAKNFLQVDAMEMPIVPNLKIIEICNKKTYKIGKFEIEFIPLTHSTIEAQGVYIKTDKGSVFHTGDWKFDDTPVLGKVSDKDRIKELVKDNPLSLLVCDSTNCMKDSKNKSESILFDSLVQIISRKKRIVVVSTFASNISRIQTMYNVAQATGRRLVVCGRSMEKIISIAQESGYLLDIDYLDAKDARKFPREMLLVLATGCQGEQNATMAKLAYNKHPFLKLQQKDCVIFSSKVIPGNELDVENIINALILRNVDIVAEKDNLVHVSGHAYRSDLKEMYELTKPLNFIPMHGDWLMLHEHAKFAKSCGIKSIITPRNGCIVEINGNSIEQIGQFNSSTICLDGNRLLDDGNRIFKDRKAIANDGFVYCSVVIDKKKNTFACQPDIRAIGLFDFNNHEHIEAMKDIAKKAIVVIKPRLFGRFGAKDIISDKLKESLKNETHKKTGKIPVIDVVVNFI